MIKHQIRITRKNNYLINFIDPMTGNNYSLCYFIIESDSYKSVKFSGIWLTTEHSQELQYRRVKLGLNNSLVYL